MQQKPFAYNVKDSRAPYKITNEENGNTFRVFDFISGSFDANRATHVVIEIRQGEDLDAPIYSQHKFPVTTLQDGTQSMSSKIKYRIKKGETFCVYAFPTERIPFGTPVQQAVNSSWHITGYFEK